VKLFQIEEPDGGFPDPDLPGTAIGVDASGAVAEAAFAVGGNAVVLNDDDGFVRVLPVPGPAAPAADWRALFEGIKLRAERVLARPVTHAVVALGAPPPSGMADVLLAAAAEAGIGILRVVRVAELPAADPPALAAACLAEDLLPPPGTKISAATYLS
jgi:hypothetical protein